MDTVFEDENTEAFLLPKAANVFNFANRELFLNNIFIICQVKSTYVRHCYIIFSCFFVIGGFEISSSEGRTQGDPTAFAIYAIAIIPLVLMKIQVVSLIPDNSSQIVACADEFMTSGKINIFILLVESSLRN